PGPRELNRAGENYPSGATDSDLALALPQRQEPGAPAPQSVQFPAFGSSAAPQNQSTPDGLSGLKAIQNSQYAPAYALSRRLSRGARTPYAYVRNVMRYLGSGYTYDENPPPSAYPLEAFL